MRCDSNEPPITTPRNAVMPCKCFEQWQVVDLQSCICGLRVTMPNLWQQCAAT